MASHTYTTSTGVTPHVYTTTGTSNVFIMNNPNTISVSNDLTPNTLQVKGKAEFEHDVEILGDLKIKNKSLKESLDSIEDRLAILRPNEDLEKRWEDLRKLRKEYMDLESEIIEKEKMWAILKK